MQDYLFFESNMYALCVVAAAAASAAVAAAGIWSLQGGAGRRALAQDHIGAEDANCHARSFMVFLFFIALKSACAFKSP
jgi:hypothetical protein